MGDAREPGQAMPSFEVLMPRLTDTMREGSVTAWLKSPGDPVNLGEGLVEVETDKSTVTVEAERDAVLIAVYAQVGEIVPVGAVIATLSKPDTRHVSETSERFRVASLPGPSEERDHPADRGSESAQNVRQAGMSLTSTQPTKAEPRTILSSPLARRLANDRGIDLSKLAPGSGPQGRVVRRDVEDAAARMPGEAQAHYRQPSLAHAAMAERMRIAKQEIPHYYLAVDTPARELVLLKDQVKQFQPHVTITHFVVMAVGAVLARFPELNCHWAAGKLRTHTSVDVAVAVARDDGVVASPVLRHVDQLSLGDIAAQLSGLFVRARTGSLSPDELQGGTLTVSNLGMHGIDVVFPIINPPQAAILGVGRIRNELRMHDGVVQPEPIMSVTLSADHRVFSGAVGAKLLRAICNLLEQPLELLIGPSSPRQH
jgi:pyruvate dehydrogenase E2 component (dihydrolipoamide acetyltransferase)